MKGWIKMYCLFRVFVVLEIDEDEKEDEIGRVVRDEIEELYVFGERDGCVLDFNESDVLKKCDDIEDCMVDIE